MEDRTAPPSVSAGLLGIVRYRELLRNLVLRDMKLKYRGSVFGFFWSLANPLLMIVTYFVVFNYILRIRTEGFIFNLLLGLLNWTFFSSSAMMSTDSVVGAGALIKSVAFPRAILPVATVLFNLVQFLLTLAVFVPVALIIFRFVPTPAMLLFPVLLTLQILFTAGVAFALATLTSFFRDVSRRFCDRPTTLFLDDADSLQHDSPPLPFDCRFSVRCLAPTYALKEIFPHGR